MSRIQRGEFGLEDSVAAMDLVKVQSQLLEQVETASSLDIRGSSTWSKLMFWKFMLGCVVSRCAVRWDRTRTNEEKQHANAG